MAAEDVGDARQGVSQVGKHPNRTGAGVVARKRPFTATACEETHMPQIDVGPDWPPPLNAYEYLRTAAMPDWAWECLRRNLDYQSSARIRHARGVVRVRLSTGALLTRLRARHVGAEGWGLCCFR